MLTVKKKPLVVGTEARRLSGVSWPTGPGVRTVGDSRGHVQNTTYRFEVGEDADPTMDPPDASRRYIQSTFGIYEDNEVLLTAPGKGDVKNIVYGINHGNIAPEDRVLSAASCTPCA